MMKKIIIMLSLALALTACGAADSSVADDPDVMIETSAFEAAEPVIYRRAARYHAFIEFVSIIF